MEDNNIKVLGTLKKEKSSKPFFVALVFVFLVAGIYFFPYIKATLGDDFTLNDLLNKTNNNTSEPTTQPISITTEPVAKPTTDVSTEPVELKKLTCKKNEELSYDFDENDKLKLINSKFTYELVNREEYIANYNSYQTKVTNIQNLGGKSTIYETDTNFVFEATIDVDNDFTQIYNVYYKLGTEYSFIKNDLIQKGYECK